jgi:glycosyltransferase involved in cell wall biosynthesis
VNKTQKLKVLIIIEHNPFFSSSASSNRWRSLIDGIQPYNTGIYLLITGGFQSVEEWKAHGFSGYIGDVRYKYLNVLFNHYIWLRRLNRYVLRFLITPVVNREIYFQIIKERADIIWTSTNLEHLKIAVGLKDMGMVNAKSFLEMSEFFDIHRYNQGNALQKREGDRRQRFFENKAFYAYDGIALMTRTLYRHYDAFPGKKPNLLHLPMTVDLDRFSNPERIAAVNNLPKPYIAFIGIMDNKKDGVNILIDAFARILDNFPRQHLHLFGHYNYDTPGHLHQIKLLNLQDKIFWHGAIDRDEVPAILMKAELLVLPRPDSKQAQGGFPTKLGEYLASGKPVCVTTVGEIPDYLQDGESAFFAEPGSVDSFASAMRRALSDPENAQRVGANGRKVAEQHFNKDIQAKILYDFLQELVNDVPK